MRKKREREREDGAMGEGCEGRREQVKEGEIEGRLGGPGRSKWKRVKQYCSAILRGLHSFVTFPSLSLCPNIVRL